jgi:UDP-N-acetylmuramyl pentapeptide phosphotransferase/UDP-N-acetylglucosamine-1-phosphate transferase
MIPPPSAAIDAAWLGAGALASWWLLALLLPRLRQRWLDQPNARSSHQRPTPRGGGLVFVLVGSAMALALGSRLPLLCVPLALVGLLDDRLDLPAGVRYGAQLLTAALLLATAATPLPWWLLPLVLVAITAVINFVNFMDGLDGLVAGCAAVLLTVAALITPSPTLWPLVGGLLGFLGWNWSPARVFMGDVGSTFLGAVFAASVLQQPTPQAALALLLVGFPLLGDACLCVLRRLAAGQPVFQAHRLHLFQRLQQAGWSHRQVASLWITATAIPGLALVLCQRGVFAGGGGGFGSDGLALVSAIVVLEALAGVWLDQHRALPFASASRNTDTDKQPK